MNNLKEEDQNLLLIARTVLSNLRGLKCAKSPHGPRGISLF